MSKFTVTYWPPPADLVGLVSGFHRYALTLGPGERHHDIFFPGWANIRFKAPGGDPWHVRLCATDYTALDGGVLFGPTSHAAFSDSGTGSVVGVGLTPLGWSRLTARSAAEFADRIAPLAGMLADAPPMALHDHERPDLLLADWLRVRLRPHRADEDRIVAIHSYLTSEAAGGVAEAAAALSLSPRRFNQLSNEFFGFGPKLLLRRARFLDSLLRLSQPSDRPWSERISPNYYDQSHFVRDAREFLGMTPGEFLRMKRPMNAASVQARAAVLGAPAQALARPQVAA